MKKLLVATLIMACSTAASAATITWEPNTGGNVTVNTFNLSGWDLGLFDDTAALTDANALNLGVSAEVSFTAAGSGNWNAINLSGGSKLLLGGKQFVFAITDGFADNWFEATSATLQAVNTTNYEVTFANGVSQVYSFDAIPTVVPVPAAVWLFGSGLIGLVGLARRKTS
jgi:hypothetical protein